MIEEEDYLLFLPANLDTLPLSLCELLECACTKCKKLYEECICNKNLDERTSDKAST